MDIPLLVVWMLIFLIMFIYVLVETRILNLGSYESPRVIKVAGITGWWDGKDLTGQIDIVREIIPDKLLAIKVVGDEREETCPVEFVEVKNKMDALAHTGEDVWTRSDKVPSPEFARMRHSLQISETLANAYKMQGLAVAKIAEEVAKDSSKPLLDASKLRANMLKEGSTGRSPFSLFSPYRPSRPSYSPPMNMGEGSEE